MSNGRLIATLDRPFRGVSIDAGIITLVHIYFILMSKTQQFPQSHLDNKNLS